MTDGSVELERRAGVALVTLRRPDKLNSLAGDMRQQLRSRIAEAARDADVHALLIRGDGKAFCAGGDVETMAALRDGGRSAEFRALLHAGAECVLALQAFPGVTLAAIHGVAAGAGLSLALNCDLRVAAEGTRLVPSWGRLGLFPDWAASFWLPRLLGHARAMAWALAATPMQAREALDLGLLHELVPPESLLDRALQLAGERAGDAEQIVGLRTLLLKGGTGGIEAALAAETEAQEERFESAEVARLLSEFMAARRQPKETSRST